MKNGAGRYHPNVLWAAFFGPSLLCYPAHLTGFLQIRVLTGRQSYHSIFRLLSLHVSYLHPTPPRLHPHKNPREETKRRTGYTLINDLSFRLSHLRVSLQLRRMEHECFSTVNDPGLQILPTGIQPR